MIRGTATIVFAMMLACSLSSLALAQGPVGQVVEGTVGTAAGVAGAATGTAVGTAEVGTAAAADTAVTGGSCVGSVIDQSLYRRSRLSVSALFSRLRLPADFSGKSF